MIRVFIGDVLHTGPASRVNALRGGGGRGRGSRRKNTSVPASAKVRFTSNWQSKRPVLPVDSQSLR
eukprot:COSAG02_NODE_38717_length_425_cov_8.917178_1_plen_65_part_01